VANKEQEVGIFDISN